MNECCVYLIYKARRSEDGETNLGREPATRHNTLRGGFESCWGATFSLRNLGQTQYYNTKDT
jgi:hypothetical protein